MRTVQEIEAELDDIFIHQGSAVMSDAAKWEELMKKWIHLFEGEYIEALFRAEKLPFGKSYFTETPLSHLHHELCRYFAQAALGESPVHPFHR